VFNATFNNISVIKWRSILLMEEFWCPRNRHWQTNSPDFGISYSLKYCLLDLFALEMYGVLWSQCMQVEGLVAIVINYIYQDFRSISYQSLRSVACVHMILLPLLLKYEPLLLKYEPLLLKYKPLLLKYEPLLLKYEPLLLRNYQWKIWMDIFCK
jgi:hypothetical protein